MGIPAICFLAAATVAAPTAATASSAAPTATPSSAPTEVALETAAPRTTPLLLARLPFPDDEGREAFLGSGAEPGGRLLLVLGEGPIPGAAALALDHAPLQTKTHRWLDADGAGVVRFALPAAEGLSVQLWRPGTHALPRACSASMPLARTLSANYFGPPAMISEFMKDPNDVTDSHGEWVEIHNLQPWRLNIEGWVLSDDSGSATVLGGDPIVLRCGPGDSIVVGADADPNTNGGVPVMGEWSSFSLRNSSDEIILSLPDGTLVDRIAYDDGVDWPDTPGRSISLDAAAHDVDQNDDGANWCEGQSPWPGGGADLGSPGAPNPSCP